MRNLAANLLTVMFIVALALLATYELARQQVAAPGPATEPVRLTVERGARMGEVAERLEDLGAIEGVGPLGGARLFRMAAQYSGKADELKFGEYEIAPGASMEEVLALLTTGGNVHYQVTVPEGRTVAEIVQMLEEADFLTGEIEEMPPEGSLLPETYNANRGDSRAEVIGRMQAAMDQVLAEAWENRASDLPLESPEELLILASIVEKETTPGEHERVASVFVNRLNKGMRLQSDPTVIYGITLGQGPLGRGIRQSELDADTPYNTYVREGLPPTPIANPGREAIMATANPADTPFFYFVADGTGGHAFAETLAEHNRNGVEWRRIERQQQAEQEAQAEESEQPAGQ
ncbi:MAG TPA: endolytic transglycosylase MltG [Paracoccaceae bacterium]|nr:endolytic transglycosylase MltG [Paracoccaceae bacterium]